MALVTIRMFLALAILLLAPVAYAEPVQYCKNGDYGRLDSCIAMSTYYNATTKSHDLYIHFSVAFRGMAGWAGVGTGNQMEDSTMFIIQPTESMKSTKSLLNYCTASWDVTNAF
jgi:hypothetical protein